MNKKLVRISIILLLTAIAALILNFLKISHQSLWRPDHSRLIFLTNLAVDNDYGNRTLELVKNIQRHKEMWESYYLGDASKVLNADEAERFLRALDLRENIYPFNRNIYRSVSDLYSSYKGRGIVMTTGNKYTKYAIHTIRMLRQLNCTLDIQIFYNGENDLKKKNRQLLENEGAEVVDVSTYLNPSMANSMKGWAVKPFVMLMSRFSEFVFLDADTLFFQDPEVMFEFNRYKETGTMYYRDRTLGFASGKTLDFFKQMVIFTSSFVRQERVWQDHANHVGESGVILMDKRRGGMFVLLLSSLMNMDPIKSVMYKFAYGDKESYWMSSEALEVPYSWALGAGGTVGYPNPNTTGSICGGLYHVDENWEPLWFNGGIEMNKHTPVGRKTIYNLTHYAIDRTMKNGKWEWERPTHPFCFLPESIHRDVGELSPHYKKIGQMIHDTWNDLHDISIQK